MKTKTLSILQLYSILYDYFGEQQWWPVDQKYHFQQKSDPRFEIIIGAILTQNTAWSNVEKSLQNLKDAEVLDIYSFNRLDESSLKEMIRPSGFYNQKAKRLLNFSQFIRDHYMCNLSVFFSQNPQHLRSELLSLSGIGPETADSILLYAAGLPFFVVDAYTKRICERIPFYLLSFDYDSIQLFFQNSIAEQIKPNEYRYVYKQFHAVLVELAKNFCKKKPLCFSCPLTQYCSYLKQ